MRLLFVSPTHSDVAPAVVMGQRLAIMHAMTHGGVTWVGDVSLDDVKLTTIDTARNRVVERALAVQPGDPGEAEGIFWCDSDILLPVDAITQLVRSERAFVTGMYYQRYPPYFPVVGRYDGSGHGVNWFVEWLPDCVAPADLCGFGCVLTSLALLRTMQAPYFHFGGMSEDFMFCRQAMDRGVQLFVHTGVQCGHVGPRQVVTVEDFQAAWAAQGPSGHARIPDGSAA